ncbi:MAG TPA: DUF4157 domain-containing protein [Thermoanaerobaculia bacterium]|nr:DUF4157 domain-containing protein [Thermoanaerobaculia bacterium]
MEHVAASSRSAPPSRNVQPPQSGRGWAAEGERGQSLDPFTRAAMESRFGHDFGSIRIHTGPEAARSAEGLGAHAYTLGLDVRFGEGRYRPDRPEGQALIAHELEHVVRAGARGPQVPRLQPDPATDHEANLRKILARGQVAKLEQYLAANPASIGVAEDLLIKNVAIHWSTQQMLEVAFRKDPASQGRMVEKVRNLTGDLRKKAVEKSEAMWKNYEAAAYEHALIEWCSKQLEKKPAAEAEIKSWKKDAEARYKDLAKKQPTLVKESNAAIVAMMKAAEPILWAQGDVLEKISTRFHSSIDDARGRRIRTYRELMFINLKENPYGITETTKQQREREQRLKSAKDKARTPQGAADPGVKELLQAQDPMLQEQAKIRLGFTAQHRDKVLTSSLPRQVLQPVGRLIVLDEEQRWAIYHKALNNIATGFGGVFSMEAAVNEISAQRSRIVEDPKALGLDHQGGVTTYPRHGEGQYDVYSQSGKDIKARLPEKVDLTRILGTRQKKELKHVSTTVRWAGQMPDNSDSDVLAKLSHGFFGFTATDPAKMLKFLKGEKTDLVPAPDVSRILAALTFKNTLAGRAPSGDIHGSLEDMRNELEAALREELSKLPTPVVIPEDVKILNDVDASTGHLTKLGKITEEAFKVFQGVRPPGWQYSPESAAAEVFKAVKRITLADNTFSTTLKQVLEGLLEQRPKVDRGGVGMTLLHKYRDAAGQDVWIAVDYFHLYDVRVKTGQSLTEGTLIGQAGTSGGSVSPHIHMAIRVYDQEPKGKVIPIGFLHPLDFFPFGQKGK